MVADGLSDADARARFFMVDRPGVLVDDMDGLEPFQVPLAQKPRRSRAGPSPTQATSRLLDVMHNAEPSVLIGVTGVFGLFSEEVVRAMAAGNEQPVIFPLSNPTSRAEATAEDVIAWTDGRAMVATGSPFSPSSTAASPTPSPRATTRTSSRASASGVRASKAHRVSDEMFMAAAHALADARRRPQPRRQPPARRSSRCAT